MLRVNWQVGKHERLFLISAWRQDLPHLSNHTLEPTASAMVSGTQAPGFPKHLSQRRPLSSCNIRKHNVMTIRAPHILIRWEIAVNPNQECADLLLHSNSCSKTHPRQNTLHTLVWKAVSKYLSKDLCSSMVVVLS